MNDFFPGSLIPGPPAARGDQHGAYTKQSHENAAQQASLAPHAGTDFDPLAITNPDNFASWDHPALYKAAESLNAEAMHGTADAWGDMGKYLSGTMRGVSLGVNGAINGAWTGPGAEQATAASTSYAARGEQLGAAMMLTSAKYHAAAGAASETKPAIPPVIQTNPVHAQIAAATNPANPLAFQLDLEAQHQAQEEARLKAVRVMESSYLPPYQQSDAGVPVLPPPVAPTAGGVGGDGGDSGTGGPGAGVSGTGTGGRGTGGRGTGVPGTGVPGTGVPGTGGPGAGGTGTTYSGNHQQPVQTQSTSWADPSAGNSAQLQPAQGNPASANSAQGNPPPSGYVAATPGGSIQGSPDSQRGNTGGSGAGVIGSSAPDGGAEDAKGYGRAPLADTTGVAAASAAADPLSGSNALGGGSAAVGDYAAGSRPSGGSAGGASSGSGFVPGSYLGSGGTGSGTGGSRTGTGAGGSKTGTGTGTRTGTGTGGGAGSAAGRTGAGMDRGGASGIGVGGPSTTAGGAAARGGATTGARGGAGMGGMGAGGGRGRGEDDYEHSTPSYLITEEHGSEIVGALPPVSPPVIGE